MPTSLLNLKRCSTAEWLLPLTALSLLLAIAGASSAHAAPPVKSGDRLVAELKQQIRQRKSVEFKSLLTQWEKKLGTKAVDPLIRIASDRTLADPDRYIALMGSAKTGGKGVAPRLIPFLRDSSWMIRNGALRALSALKDPAAGPHVLKLLRDPALVVRLEAVAAVDRLRPAEASAALVAAVHDNANYHANRAQWVPIRALDVLAKIGDTGTARKLAPALDRQGDPEFLRKTIQTMELLTHKKLEPGRPLAAQVQAWKHALK